MAYLPPTISAQGITVPAYQDILQDLMSKFRSIYGQSVYLGIDSSDYQMLAAFSSKIADVMLAINLTYAAQSPISATGVHLDALVKLNGLARAGSSASTCQVLITGTPGAQIVNGVIQDVNGYSWDLPPIVTIGTSGLSTVGTVCETPGAISANAGQLNIIQTPTNGWTSVTNTVNAILGQAVEADSSLRARQALSVALPSMSQLAGLTSSVAAISGVTRYLVIENPTGAVDSFGTPAHSVTAVVEGSTDLAVATAIYGKKGIGAYTNGTTAVTVTDQFNGTTQTVQFYRPTYVPIYVSLSVHGFAGYTTATTAAIRAAIVAYLNSLQIGESVTISSLYGAALAVMPNIALPLFSIRALTAGTAASPTGTADINLTINQVAQGTLANILVTLV